MQRATKGGLTKRCSERLAGLAPHFPWNSTLNPQRRDTPPAVADLLLVTSMTGTQRNRIGAVVLVCIAVGLFASRLRSYIYHWYLCWQLPATWRRLWIG